jgi:hypothetical protein
VLFGILLVGWLILAGAVVTSHDWLLAVAGPFLGVVGAASLASQRAWGQLLRGGLAAWPVDNDFYRARARESKQLRMFMGSILLFLGTSFFAVGLLL